MSQDPATRQRLQALRSDIRFTENLRGQPMSFQTTWGLFSPRAIDEGSRLLIDHLDIRPDEHALDLGCGYGPLGLVIAREAPQGFCTLVDKDFVAVEYAKRNAALNGIQNVDVRLSDGFRHLDPQARFSLVVSNLPAKTTKEHYYLFFYDALEHLEPGGRIYVVVITGLRQFIKRAFTEVFGNHDKIKQGRTYTVAMARKPG